MSGPPPKPFHPLKTALAASVLILAFVWAYFLREAPRPVNPGIQGRTMGTTYSVRLAGSPLSLEALQELRRRVEARLADISRAMSTYDASSEISRFNAHPGGQPVPLSPDFARVLGSALELAERTGGAFDPTLEPLLDLWGFDHEPDGRASPSEAEIEAVRARCGYALIGLDAEGLAAKRGAGLRLNLNAIAKGYGVDALAELLRQEGLKDFFVEIGGEVVVQGLSPRKAPWRIGIEQPLRDERSDLPYGLVHLSKGALATSGDYRNFRQTPDGEILAHILDPRTGRPATHALASVSVLAETCMAADAVATALYVMGPEEGLAWVEANPDFDALFILRRADGTLETRMSAGFAGRTGYEEASRAPAPGAAAARRP